MVKKNPLNDVGILYQSQFCDRFIFCRRNATVMLLGKHEIPLW